MFVFRNTSRTFCASRGMHRTGISLCHIFHRPIATISAIIVARATCQCFQTEHVNVECIKMRNAGICTSMRNFRSCAEHTCSHHGIRPMQKIIFLHQHADAEECTAAFIDGIEICRFMHRMLEHALLHSSNARCEHVYSARLSSSMSLLMPHSAFLNASLSQIYRWHRDMPIHASHGRACSVAFVECM